jgi:hypothetical protein
MSRIDWHSPQLSGRDSATQARKRADCQGRELRVGAFYLLRGGHMLRYQGLYSNKGPCLAFGAVDIEGPFDPPCGYSASEGDVLQEITPADLEWLRFRREERKARNIGTEDVDYLIAALGKLVP